MVPNLYLLLTQTLAKMHTYPITLLLVLRQARCSADQLNATLSGFAYSSAAIHGSASHLLDSEFALTVLQILNTRGLLSGAAVFFPVAGDALCGRAAMGLHQHVMGGGNAKFRRRAVDRGNADAEFQLLQPR